MTLIYSAVIFNLGTFLTLLKSETKWEAFQSGSKHFGKISSPSDVFEESRGIMASSAEILRFISVLEAKKGRELTESLKVTSAAKR